jgi:hypothetical protein
LVIGMRRLTSLDVKAAKEDDRPVPDFYDMCREHGIPSEVPDIGSTALRPDPSASSACTDDSPSECAPSVSSCATASNGFGTMSPSHACEHNVPDSMTMAPTSPKSSSSLGNQLGPDASNVLLALLTAVLAPNAAATAPVASAGPGNQSESKPDVNPDMLGVLRMISREHSPGSSSLGSLLANLVRAPMSPPFLTPDPAQLVNPLSWLQMSRQQEQRAHAPTLLQGFGTGSASSGHLPFDLQSYVHLLHQQLKSQQATIDALLLSLHAPQNQNQYPCLVADALQQRHLANVLASVAPVHGTSFSDTLRNDLEGRLPPPRGGAVSENDLKLALLALIVLQNSFKSNLR